MPPTGEPVDPASPAFAQRFPTLARLVGGYEHFLTAQRTLLAAKYGDAVAEGKFVLITNAEKLRFERACLHLLYNMFNEYYEPVALLGQDEKVGHHA